MTERQDPDLPLLRAMASGDTSACAELYARHGRSILAYLIGQLSGDQKLAEEVLQDVMLAAWQGATKFRGESKVKTWLLAIARLKALNARRRKRPTAAELHENIAGDAPTPQHVIERYATRLSVREAIRELPDDQRETLELIFYHDLTGAEAAGLLGVAVGTVKSRLHRAKNTLRGILQRKEVEE